MHERKKGGVRKDKKNERMREAVKESHANAAPPKPTHDEKDIVTHKSGSRNDRTVDPSARNQMRGG